MEILTFKQIQKLNYAKLEEKILEIRKNLFNLKFKQATKKSIKTHLLKQNKRMLAQLLTFKTQLKK